MIASGASDIACASPRPSARHHPHISSPIARLSPASASTRLVSKGSRVAGRRAHIAAILPAPSPKSSSLASSRVAERGARLASPATPPQLGRPARCRPRLSCRRPRWAPGRDPPPADGAAGNLRDPESRPNHPASASRWGGGFDRRRGEEIIAAPIRECSYVSPRIPHARCKLRPANPRYRPINLLGRGGFGAVYWRRTSSCRRPLQ